jgi:hypothetical protein
MEYTGKVLVAMGFDDYVRRRESCGIAASNAAKSQAVTYIHRDPLGNIPNESREGASEALGQALNVRNRESKRRGFGFSTFEDAVTWVVFTYLLRSGQLLAAFRGAGLIADETLTTSPTLLLWGCSHQQWRPWGEDPKTVERAVRRPSGSPEFLFRADVIVDLGEDGLMFIEVKHLSGNNLKPADYRGWSRYASAGRLAWRIEDVKASGCYELARNWCLLNGLAAGRRASLVSLGPAKLLLGTEGARLDRFVAALGTNERSHFMKIRWPDLHGNGLGAVPDWFAQFCRSRGLMA